jgi:hypothetical protein
MIRFLEFITEDFLIEKAGEGMKSSIKDFKTKGHIKRYIFPYLSAEQKKVSANDLSSIFNDKDIKDSDLETDGEFHNPKSKNTHSLSIKYGQHEAGTPVNITGLHVEGNTVMARTKDHGIIPLSKIGKPESLAAENITSEGFKLESKLQKNIDPRFKPAGSTGESWDYVAGDPDTEHSIKGKAVKKDESKPIFRGESKASKKGTVAMGTISAGYNIKTGQWEYSKSTKSKMGEKFEEAVHPESGLSIIDHLNKHYPEGNLTRGFSMQAPAGTARHYLNGLGANSLHLHRYAVDSTGNYVMNHGTTYTVGDNNHFEGQLGMGHLSNEDLNKLDGTLTVEPAGFGKIQIKHRPKPSVFNEYADRSQKNPEKHLDVSQEDHGVIFRNNFANYLRNVYKPPSNPISATPETSNPTPSSTYHSSHGGKLWSPL